MCCWLDSYHTFSLTLAQSGNGIQSFARTFIVYQMFCLFRCSDFVNFLYILKFTHFADCRSNHFEPIFTERVCFGVNITFFLSSFVCLLYVCSVLVWSKTICWKEIFTCFFFLLLRPNRYRFDTQMRNKVIMKKKKKQIITTTKQQTDKLNIITICWILLPCIINAEFKFDSFSTLHNIVYVCTQIEFKINSNFFFLLFLSIVSAFIWCTPHKICLYVNKKKYG